MSLAYVSVPTLIYPLGLEPDRTRAVLEQTSPDLNTRKQGHINDYLERTIATAQHRLGRMQER